VANRGGGSLRQKDLAAVGVPKATGGGASRRPTVWRRAAAKGARGRGGAQGGRRRGKGWGSGEVQQRRELAAAGARCPAAWRRRKGSWSEGEWSE